MNKLVNVFVVLVFNLRLFK